MLFFSSGSLALAPSMSTELAAMPRTCNDASGTQWHAVALASRAARPVARAAQLSASSESHATRSPCAVPRPCRAEAAARAAQDHAGGDGGLQAASSAAGCRQRADRDPSPPPHARTHVGAYSFPRGSTRIVSPTGTVLTGASRAPRETHTRAHRWAPRAASISPSCCLPMQP